MSHYRAKSFHSDTSHCHHAWEIRSTLVLATNESGELLRVMTLFVLTKFDATVRIWRQTRQNQAMLGSRDDNPYSP
jgi:hypothetical protein